MSHERGVRTLVVRCPDWPVVAAGVPLATPAVVLHANRVVACSPAARRAGVEAGLRRREAQARCPDVEVLEHDLPTEARRFEGVLAAVEAFTPRLEVRHPGTCAVPTRGPSRYFGGDPALAGLVAAAVDEVLVALDPAARCGVGVADGSFAAEQAARHPQAASAPLIVPPGQSDDFLAPLPLRVLDRPELVDVLVRLGLRTLGDLAALPAPDVLARFGLEGEAAHRLARGLDPLPPRLSSLPPDLDAATELDPPAERIDPVAFAAKSLADDIHERLAALGLACTGLVIEAETDHGERHERVWRHDGALSAADMADRARWQLEGWLDGPVRSRPTAGITRLVLTPLELRAATGRQLGFWGGETEAAERATRALARVEGLLGPEEVAVPEWRGGRGSADQLVLVPAGAVDLVARAEAPPSRAQGSLSRDQGSPSRSDPPPWPGQVPAPAPAGVHRPPLPAEVLDGTGRPVGVDGRGVLSAPPARLVVDGGAALEVEAWAGPWPIDERWWDPARHRRRARLQLVTRAGTAHLLSLEAGRWSCESTYD